MTFVIVFLIAVGTLAAGQLLYGKTKHMYLGIALVKVGFLIIVTCFVAFSMGMILWICYFHLFIPLAILLSVAVAICMIVLKVTKK